MANHIESTAFVSAKVQLGDNISIGHFCLIGESVDSDKQETTIIGDNATIRSHTIIYPGNKIGSHFSTGHRAQIRENNTIGNNVSIGTNSVIEHHVHIGNNVRLHTGVFVPEFSTLKDNCWLGPHVVLTNAKFPLHPQVKSNLHGPTIDEGAIIGANATILPGVHIGRRCLIGAGSVVTTDTQPGGIYIGNPARYTGKNVDY